MGNWFYFTTPLTLSMLHQHHGFSLIFTLAAGLSLTACASPAVANIPVDSTEAATALPAAAIAASPTIVWFPPSATPSPVTLATRIPTPEEKPGIGPISITDDFSSPTLWNTGSSAAGSAITSSNSLTLAVPALSYIYRLRNDLDLDNFYAEVTAHTSLCRGPDEYGFLVRASANTYYRFSLSCNGFMQLDRVKGGSRQILQPAIPSGDVPPGAPGEVVLGVWAAGSDLRFFLNGRYQFSVNDKNYLSGTLGVFALSSGNTPVTITFSDLVVYDVTYSPAKTPRP
jgi:hypothetical protein